MPGLENPKVLSNPNITTENTKVAAFRLQHVHFLKALVTIPLILRAIYHIFSHLLSLSASLPLPPSSVPLSLPLSLSLSLLLPPTPLSFPSSPTPTLFFICQDLSKPLLILSIPAYSFLWCNIIHHFCIKK